MTNERIKLRNDVQELAKQLFIGALASATDLGHASMDERKELLEEVRAICFEAAEVFYQVEE